MTRKYRQQGYQDEDRERGPKPPPQPKGTASRVETRFQQITRCSNCAAEIQIMDKIQFAERCQACGTDLHTCRNCLHFDPSARNECTEPVEVRVSNKSSNNVCPFFEPKVLVEKQGSGAPASRGVDSRRQAFYDLFKK